LISLRPITPAHAQEILSQLARGKIRQTIFDYDDTLAEFKKPISPEMGAAFESVSQAGTEIMILTDRPDTDSRRPEDTILASLSPLTVTQKLSILLSSSRGTRFLLFDRKGNPLLIQENKVQWAEKEKTNILAAGKMVAEHYGSQEYNGREEELSEYAYVRFLPIGLPVDQVKAAANLMESELKKQGLSLEVVGRTAKKPTDPPYIHITKIDKSSAVKYIRKNYWPTKRLRTLLSLGLSRKLVPLVLKILKKLRSREILPSRTLLVGDQFFDTRMADREMGTGAPGAITISVGGTADPRLENIFVWPKEGEPASLEILRALSQD
ncbi:MAG: hypothetical protein HY400_04100, partial [Elusimicrobia bacterium]|nr:hypothetical protein [Elusimicrobiota bacterium]